MPPATAVAHAKKTTCNAKQRVLTPGSPKRAKTPSFLVRNEKSGAAQLKILKKGNRVSAPSVHLAPIFSG